MNLCALYFFLKLAFIVAQSRDRDGRLSGIKLSALSTGLMKVARVAKKKNGMPPLPLLC